MSDVDIKYVVTYHYKDGEILNEVYDDYVIARFAANAEMEAHRDTRDFFEIKEIITMVKQL